ncbi:bifunctional TH2 protein, mitochondrial-like [Papaver somniferum]|uniref:bifunctional TH2 protein, mitochondrial-like n=1 Tax=Papaver somniferum TaxID=3469 RepID=UPI000E6FF8FE|nr:bifunctional TH2 protein, mitochondrial-like [Papaver somniferum]XP_026381412.1 bifunctional TH2 protein, mitochondrial-like [Papaver somniferum]XP_026381413.1 bifunctional TH2 protein, mitochondrial-like [Papaver somniferum]
MVYTFSQSCWASCYEEAVCCLYSPLNVCLASGDLHKRNFHHYINQWGHFLIAFPQAYDIVLESLEDQQEDVQAAILEKRNFITQELQWHASFIQECDLDPTAETTQHSVTAQYVNFLLATASGNQDMVHLEIPTPAEKLKIAAHVLSAITPCVRVSATLAKLIKPLTRRNKRPRRFNMWIDRYSSDEFEALTVQTEGLLDWLSNSLTDKERKVLGEVYHQAMKLEVEFFYSRLSVPTKLIPVSLLHNREEERLLLFSVFDFACTAVDSLQGLEQMTLSSAKEKSIVGLPPRPGRRPRPGNTHLQMSRADLQKAWDAIVVFDKREMDEWLLKILVIPIAVGFDYDGLCKVLEQLSVIRDNGISRIIETGVLKGLSLSRMQLAGTRMNLYHGCVNFFEKVFRNEALNASAHVISCWCEDLMRSALPGARRSAAFWMVVVTLATLILPCQQMESQASKRMLEAGISLERDPKKQKVQKSSSYEPFIRCLACRRRLLAWNLSVVVNNELLGLLSVRGGRMVAPTCMEIGM